MRREPLGRRLLAEFLGTGLLVAAVIGSGIAATKLSPGDVGLELFENAAATAGALIALILAFGPVSGAHFNPVVTLVDRMFGGVSNADAAGYVVAQIFGALGGALPRMQCSRSRGRSVDEGAVVGSSVAVGGGRDVRVGGGDLRGGPFGSGLDRAVRGRGLHRRLGTSSLRRRASRTRR